MKRFFTILLAIFLFCAPACTKYKSNYDAVGMIRTNTRTEFSASFEKLEGTLVGKIQSTSNEDGALQCTASLVSGEMNVYYYDGSIKFLLFTLQAGESIDDARGYYSNGARVYIIVETVTPCKGNFHIHV